MIVRDSRAERSNIRRFLVILFAHKPALLGVIDVKDNVVFAVEHMRIGYDLPCMRAIRLAHRMKARAGWRRLLRLNLQAYANLFAVIRYILHNAVRRSV